MAEQCASCAKTSVSLKRCAKCQTTHYCSRDCQKADWKVHKKVCALNAANSAAATASSNSTSNRPPITTQSSSTSTPLKGLTTRIEKPFHRLHSKTYLHDLPENDVYKLLIDSYRLRLEDDYTLESDAAEDSIYGGAADSRVGFRKFLRKAEKKAGLLPSWWSKGKFDACVLSGVRVEPGHHSGRLACAVEKGDVIEEYGNPLMPMQLRMFAEEVIGRGPGGMAGAVMMQMQMHVESGEGTGTNFDNTRFR